ncbi:hypothetical protein BBP40_002532 [Aspergillus hancockii]|nr:hypothetical protein BBP40_002532 [Aspergillus hancockii]
MRPSAATILTAAQLDPRADQQRGPYVSQAFALCFPSDSVAPGTRGYEPRGRVPWNSLIPRSTNCWLQRQPQVIVCPSPAQQVATALALCRFFDVTFPIRRGGHLQIPGFTSNDGGMSLDAHNLAVAGGRVPDVGASGLLLGEGISFQNSQYGMGAVAVCNYEIILPDSQIINANVHENTDPPEPNLGRSQHLPAHSKQATPRRADAVSHSHRDRSSLLSSFYYAPVDRPAIFQPFYDIPSLATLVPAGVRTVYDLAQAVASLVAGEPELYFPLLSLLPLTMIRPRPRPNNGHPADVLAGYGSHARWGCPLGLEPVGQHWFLVRADWKDAKDEERVRRAIRVIVDAAAAAARQHGVYLSYMYSNYAARNQDPLASYGVENIKQLGEIARKYDPEGVFQRLQNCWGGGGVG